MKTELLNLRTLLIGLLLASLTGCVAPGARHSEPAQQQDRPETVEEADAEDRESAPAVLWRFDAPRSYEQVSSAPVKTLVRQAAIERDAEVPERAAASLERAIRIEPRNAFVWGLLSALRLEMEMPREASALARKSNSLAQTNPFVQLRNWRVIEEAEDEVDDSEDLEEAEARVEHLEDLLGDGEDEEWWWEWD